MVQVISNQLITYILIQCWIRLNTKPFSSYVYIALTNHNVVVFDVLKLIQNFRLKQNIATRIGYNPQRQLRQNFYTEMTKRKYSTCTLNIKYNESIISYKVIKVHSCIITSISIINLYQRYLVTLSQDHYIKILKNFQQICDFNINLLLPYQCNLSIIEQNRFKDKIMLGLKVIQSIFLKFGSDISIIQSKFLKLNKLFEKIQCDHHFHMTQPILSEPNDVRLVQTEFSIRDLHYLQIKKINFREMAGPTLKQIDLKKKILDMQKQWQQSKIIWQQQKSRLLMTIQYRAKKIHKNNKLLNFQRKIKKSSYKLKDIIVTILLYQPQAKKLIPLIQKKRNYDKKQCRQASCQGKRKKNLLKQFIEEQIKKNKKKDQQKNFNNTTDKKNHALKHQLENQFKLNKQYIKSQKYFFIQKYIILNE